MKKQIISKEFLRMQQLAGIINESEYKKYTSTLKTRNILLRETILSEVSQDDINKAIAKATKVPIDKIEDILSDKDKNNDKNKLEEGSLLITLALLAPILLEAVGWLTNKVKRQFLSGQEKKELEILKKKIEDKKLEKKNLDKKSFGLSKNEFELEKQIKHLEHEMDEKFGSKIGNWFKSAGHELHKAYTVPILLILEGIATVQRWKGNKESLFQDPEYRQKIANIVYAVIMIGIAGVGIAGSLSHLTGVKEVMSVILEAVKGGKSIKDTVVLAFEAL